MKLYTEEQMRQASKFGWFHGNDDATEHRDGVDQFLAELTPVQAPVVPEAIPFEEWWDDFKQNHQEWQFADREAILKQAYQAHLHQGQAPVVPSVEELQKIIQVHATRDAYEGASKAVHAHLLTHGWREGTGWIPVSERLPEIGMVCILASRGKVTGIAQWGSVKMPLPGWVFTNAPEYSAFIGEDVTHWQPLPEPPVAPTPDLSDESHAPWIVVEATPAPLLYWCPVHGWVGRVDKAALFFSYSEALDVAEKHQAHVVPLETVNS